MIVDHIAEFRLDPIFARVSKVVDDRINVLLKLEGFNPGGSIKLKPAIALVNDLQRRGAIADNSILIDTSSGNMGIALAILAKSMGLGFVCVTDEKITLHNHRLIQAYGGEVVILENSNQQDRNRYIGGRLAEDLRYVWTRQFENVANPAVHEVTTAREILDSLAHVDYLFIGVGTGGTLAGCARVFSAESPDTLVIAVDAEGSRHFQPDCDAVRRRIPGIGASQRSPFIDDVTIHDAVIVPERAAVEHCKLLLERTGWLLGGSSGSVLSAVLSYAERIPDGAMVVGVCADFGERYLDSVYTNQWGEMLVTSEVL